MQQIRGPLGIWPFPILNFLLMLVSQINQQNQQKSSTSFENQPRKKIYQLVRDDKGRIVEIVEIEA